MPPNVSAIKPSLELASGRNLSYSSKVMSSTTRGKDRQRRTVTSFYTLLAFDVTCLDPL